MDWLILFKLFHFSLWYYFKKTCHLSQRIFHILFSADCIFTVSFSMFLSPHVSSQLIELKVWFTLNAWKKYVISRWSNSYGIISGNTSCLFAYCLIIFTLRRDSYALAWCFYHKFHVSIPPWSAAVDDLIAFISCDSSSRLSGLL